jgi:hypothetical protein
MENVMKNNILLTSLFIIAALLLGACGPSTEQIATMTASAWTPTPIFTSTPISTATSVPTPTPAPPPGLGISSICVQVNITGETGGKKLLTEVLGEVLYEGMGLKNLDNCDATLTVSAEFGAEGIEYKVKDSSSTKTCYTSSSAKGEMTFQVSGKEVHTYLIDKNYVPFGIDTYICPETPGKAYFQDAWAKDVVDGLYEIFGPKVLGYCVTNQLPQLMYAGVNKYKSVGVESHAVTGVLLGRLNELFEGREQDLFDFDNTMNNVYPIVDTLKIASGQDFGYDLIAWNKWWKTQ